MFQKAKETLNIVTHHKLDLFNQGLLNKSLLADLLTATDKSHYGLMQRIHCINPLINKLPNHFLVCENFLLFVQE